MELVYDHPVMLPDEAAQLLRVSMRQLRELELHEGLPVHRMGHGSKAQRRFLRDELIRWLEFRCTANPAGEAVS